MYQTALQVEVSEGAGLALDGLNLAAVSREELSSHIRASLPNAVVQRLRAPTSSSVPLIVCTYPRLVQSRAFSIALALYARQEGGTSGDYSEMCAQIAELPLQTYNGVQLSDWFAHGVEMYYTRSMTRRLDSDGEPNPNYVAEHRVSVPIAEFVSPSIESSYARLVCAVADLDDGGSAHDEVGHIGAVTHDAVAPAGIQFIHLREDGAVACCFVTFDHLVADAHGLVMF